MPSNFRPASMESVKYQAKKNAKGGEVFQLGNGLMYVPTHKDGNRVKCYSGLVREFGWALHAVELFGPDDEPWVFIAPINEVPDNNGE